MADNLLDKASILLTPTAYNDGSMLSIKPENGDGDFTFSRSSAATRVNAQGLVENVQIISPELVSNGNFSQIGTEEVLNGNFSQEGSELVTNGDFATDSDWIFSGSANISNGVGNFPDNTNSFIIQDNVVPLSIKTYKIQYEVITTNGSNFRLAGGVSAFGTVTLDSSTTGIKTFYLQSNGTQDRLQFNNNNFIGSIDNISVKEVGQNWTLGTGWSIGEDKAVATSGASTKLTQSISGLSGKTCKVSFTLSDYGGNGSVRVDFGSVSTDPINTNGEHIVYGTYDNNAFELFKNTGFSGSITNISVKEVGQDWTLGTGWSVDQANSKAICDGTQGYITQTNVSGAGVTATYKVQWTQNITVGARLRFFARNYNDTGNITTLSITRDDGVVVGGGNCVGSGTFTAYLSSTNGYSFKILAEAGVEAAISNISVKEITDDTDIPRINYSGFSYQDSLGSELVVNGDFATDSNWSLSSGSSIANGKLTIDALDGSYQYAKQIVNTTIGSTYKLEFDITEINDVGKVQLLYNNAIIGETEYNSIGTYTLYFESTNSSGLLEIKRMHPSDTNASIDNVSVKEYFGQEVVPDSGCGNWLLEPQSTNLINNSELLNTYFSYKIDTTITDNYGTSPSGETNSSRIQFVDDTSFCYNVISVSTDHTSSVFVKGVSGETVRFGIGSSVLTGDLFTFNGLWQRIDFTASSATQIFFSSYGGATTRDFEAFGLQLEALSYATSYIPTNGATNTRLQDIANNSGNASLINSTEGVLYAEIAALAYDGTNRRISLSDGTLNNRILLYYGTGNNLLILFIVNGVTQVSFTYSYTITNFSKIAFKYKENDFALWVDGSKVATDTNGNTLSLNTLDRLNFNTANGALPFYGKAKALAVYKEALTDAELQSLTTI